MVDLTEVAGLADIACFGAQLSLAGFSRTPQSPEESYRVEVSEIVRTVTRRDGWSSRVPSTVYTIY